MPEDYTHFRYRHTYMLGLPGTGKTTLLSDFIMESILRREGLLYFDFTGEGIDNLLPYIPRVDDTVLIDPRYPTPFNLFENVTDRSRTAMAVLDFFRALAKYTPELSTPVFDQFILFAAHTVMDKPDPTILDMKYVLTNPDYRTKILEHCTDNIIADFWTKDMSLIKDVYDKMQSVLNKLNWLLVDIRIRRIVSYPTSVLNFTEARETNKIVLVRLPVSEFGIEGSRAIARIILAHFSTSLYRSTEPFHIYIDDAQNIQGQMLIDLLSTARRQNVSVTLAHQYLDQLTYANQMAVFGNTGTKVVFRVSVKDADTLEQILPGNQNLFYLYEMPQYRARMQTPVSHKAVELDIKPLSFPTYHRSASAIKRLSREQYRFNKNRVDKHIEKVRSGE